MAFEIIKQNIKKNPLMHRDEIYMLAKTDGKIPSLKEIQEYIKNKLNVREACIDINKIETKFGLHDINIFAFIYENENWLKKFKKHKAKEKQEKTKEKAEEKQEKTEEKAGEKKE